MLKIVAGMRALDDLRPEQIATAADPEGMSKKIEALRKQFREQSIQVSYESKQKLAGLLREVSHVLTDLIHAMNINGEDAGSMSKLQNQVSRVTRSLSFVGEDDANKDGIKDSAEEPSLGLNLGDKTTTEDSHEAFKSAVKSIAPEKKADPTDESGAKPVDKAEKSDTKTLPAKTDKKQEPEDDTESEEEESEEPAPKSVKKKPVLKVKTKTKEKTDDTDSEEGGLVKGLLAEGSFEVTASLRFCYLGPKTVTKQGVKFEALRAGFGTHDKDTMKVYYYKPTKKFFNGDATKCDKAFRKILDSVEGYSVLSTEINAKVRAGYLEVVSVKELDASQVMRDAETSWSYRGVHTHPKDEDRQALWFEIGALEFAAVPSKNFEAGDVNEADAWIRTHIIGSKSKGVAGSPYTSGLQKLEALVDNKKIKVIFHGAI
jgi:hypothetical protein